MTQSIKQKRAILKGLHMHLAYSADQHPAQSSKKPAAKRRFIVVPSNNNGFVVVERATGTPQGEYRQRDEACLLAELLEQKTRLRATGAFAAKQFSRYLLCWTIALVMMILVFSGAA